MRAYKTRPYHTPQTCIESKQKYALSVKSTIRYNDTRKRQALKKKKLVKAILTTTSECETPQRETKPHEMRKRIIHIFHQASHSPTYVRVKVAMDRDKNPNATGSLPSVDDRCASSPHNPVLLITVPRLKELWTG